MQYVILGLQLYLGWWIGANLVWFAWVAYLRIRIYLIRRRMTPEQLKTLELTIALDAYSEALRRR